MLEEQWSDQKIRITIEKIEGVLVFALLRIC